MTTRTLATMVAEGMTASQTRGLAFRVTGGDEAVGSTVELLNGATDQTTPVCATVTVPVGGTFGTYGEPVVVGSHVDISPEYLSPVGGSVTFADLVARGEEPPALRARRFVVLPNASSRYVDASGLTEYVGATVAVPNGAVDRDGDVYVRVLESATGGAPEGYTAYIKPEYLATEDGTETRDAATLARELAVMTALRDAAVSREAAAREGLAQRVRWHEEDIATIGARLTQEATEREWCGEYDRILDDLNGDLHVSLPPRVTSITLYITDEDGSNLYTLTVESDDPYDAAGDVARVASRNLGNVTDYNPW